LWSRRFDAAHRVADDKLNLTALEKAPAERDFAKFLLSDLEKYVGYANLTTLPNLQYQEAIRRVSFAR